MTASPPDITAESWSEQEKDDVARIAVAIRMTGMVSVETSDLHQGFLRLLNALKATRDRATLAEARATKYREALLLAAKALKRTKRFAADATHRFATSVMETIDTALATDEREGGGDV